MPAPATLTGPPVIGISCYLQRARWSYWDDEAILLPRRYGDKVAQAGGLPVILPPVPGNAAILPRLDGLILSGGGDIDPACYGAARDGETGPANAGRGRAELDLCTAALASGLPLLGICRGLQVINVSLGGTLHQHLPGLVGHNGHSPEDAGYGSHKVSIAADSRLAEVLGTADRAVPTHHHQAIDKLGAGLAATSWTSDGIIEAVEFTTADPHSSFMLAVQWHPEAGDDLRLFSSLITAARQRVAEPVGS